MPLILTRRCILGLLVLGMIYLPSVCPKGRADSQPTDDGQSPGVDTEQGLIFATGNNPGKPVSGLPRLAAVPYEWVVRFTGSYEQTVTLYQWTDGPNGGCWVRRAFLNSYFQGPGATISFPLAVHQRFLVVAYHKDAEAPATDRGWSQARLDHGDITKITHEAPLPSVEAVFKHEKGSTLVSIRPDPHSPAPAAPTTHPATQPTSAPS